MGTDGAQTGEPLESRTRRFSIASALGWMLVAAFVASGALMLSARWTTLGELASHGRWHLGLTAALAALPFTLLHRWRHVGALAAVAAWGILPEGTLWLGSPELSASETSLGLVSANVLRVNVRYDEVLDGILALDADVVGLLEVSPEWREQAIRALGERYPHRAEGLDTSEWSRRTWGLLLFSKTPLTNVDVTPIYCKTARLRPFVRADVTLGGEPVTIQLAHTQRPGSPTRLGHRARHFEVLCAPIDAAHRVIFGDLNTTSTSPLFSDLCEGAGVRDSRDGFGRLPTWRFQKTIRVPFRVRLPEAMRPAAAIDHALVSEGLAVLHRGTFRIPGSDHDGICVRIALREPGRD